MHAAVAAKFRFVQYVITIEKMRETYLELATCYLGMFLGAYHDY